MAVYAKVNNSLVEQVIVAEPEFFNTFVDDSAGEWIETKTDGSIRKHYAGIGYTYNRTLDAFIPKKPFPSWVLDEETCLWEAPTSKPTGTDNQYVWDEDTTSWVVDSE
jgi:hypothetical protein